MSLRHGRHRGSRDGRNDDDDDDDDSMAFMDDDKNSDASAAAGSAAAATTEPAAPFVPSSTFRGSKSGYVFRTSTEYGTGYHRDDDKKTDPDDPHHPDADADPDHDRNNKKRRIPSKSSPPPPTRSSMNNNKGSSGGGGGGGTNGGVGVGVGVGTFSSRKRARIDESRNETKVFTTAASASSVSRMGNVGDEDDGEDDDGDIVMGRLSSSSSSASSSSSSSSASSLLLKEAEASVDPKSRIMDLSVRGVRKAVSNLHVMVETNALRRAQHAEQPELYMESELSLHDQLQSFQSVAAYPSRLYPVLYQYDGSESESESARGSASRGGESARGSARRRRRSSSQDRNVPRPEVVNNSVLLQDFESLLSHENHDMALTVLKVLVEWLDSTLVTTDDQDHDDHDHDDQDHDHDDDDQDDEKEKDETSSARTSRAVSNLARAISIHYRQGTLLELVVANLGRILPSRNHDSKYHDGEQDKEEQGDEEDEQDQQGVRDILTLVENLIEIHQKLQSRGGDYDDDDDDDYDDHHDMAGTNHGVMQSQSQKHNTGDNHTNNPSSIVVMLAQTPLISWLFQQLLKQPPPKPKQHQQPKQPKPSDSSNYYRYRAAELLALLFQQPALHQGEEQDNDENDNKDDENDDESVGNRAEHRRKNGTYHHSTSSSSKTTNPFHDLTRIPIYMSSLVEQPPPRQQKTKKGKDDDDDDDHHHHQTLDGLEILLQVIAQFRKRQPETEEDIDLLENVSTALASALTYHTHHHHQRRLRRRRRKRRKPQKRTITERQKRPPPQIEQTRKRQKHQRNHRDDDREEYGDDGDDDNDVDDPPLVQTFIKEAQGMELVLRCVKERVHAGVAALPLLDLPSSRNAVEHLMGHASGLKLLFPLFMMRSVPKPAEIMATHGNTNRNNNDDDDNHHHHDKRNRRRHKKRLRDRRAWLNKVEMTIVSIFYNCARFLRPASPHDCYARFLVKFRENEFEKCTRLVDLVLKYDEKARLAEYKFYRTHDEDDDDDDDDDNDDTNNKNERRRWLEMAALDAKLRGGGDTFCRVGALAAFVCAHSKSCHAHVRRCLSDRRSGMGVVRGAVEEFLRLLGGHPNDDKNDDKNEVDDDPYDDDSRTLQRRQLQEWLDQI